MSEFAAGIAGALSPFGTTELPLPEDKLLYTNPLTIINTWIHGHLGPLTTKAPARTVRGAFVVSSGYRVRVSSRERQLALVLVVEVDLALVELVAAGLGGLPTCSRRSGPSGPSSRAFTTPSTWLRTSSLSLGLRGGLQRSSVFFSFFFQAGRGLARVARRVAGEPGAAGRPGTLALAREDALGDLDLLRLRGLVSSGCVLGATVAGPGARRELQAAPGSRCRC